MNDIKGFYDKYWSEERGEFGSYVRNLELTNFFKEGDVILDIGCGDGTVAEFLQKKIGVKVVGLEISEEAIRKAKDKGIDARIGSSEEKFPFKDNTFDKVFWGDNVEHLFNPTFTLKEIKRVLKKDGKLILSCPNMGYWRYRVHYFLNGSLPDTEWTGLPPWEWAHIRFFNLKILENFIRSSGFKKITKVVGISERRLDKPFIRLKPSLFGMIFLLEII